MTTTRNTPETTVPTRHQFERPTREKWTADAEHHVRTLCMPSERVSSQPADWLNADELAELQALIPAILKTARTALNRAIRPHLHAFDDEPRGYGWYDWRDALTPEQRAGFDQLCNARRDRTHLNAVVRRATGAWADVDTVTAGVGDLVHAVRTYGQPDPDTERLAELGHALSERRSTAAQEATEQAVQQEVARRQTDEAWTKQVRRWDDLDRTGGVTITFH
ncbi:hypothetical protein GXW83_27505 [Streptacidiphilus sp. PB12-B1b]|uniref:hypothetical protein n=1 Tax=Streptacidiphilus sp. PB12-B1b TaxID=2705012 RepID=UPI0015FABF34|nr:hypothetical protein [Streptacidiphilus sp. PB12-B1b]QMU78892.1 hypothetical protein GXW83_27505 [Streptacidiphilus sp. PB12-B1b]